MSQTTAEVAKTKSIILFYGYLRIVGSG